MDYASANGDAAILTYGKLPHVKYVLQTSAYKNTWSGSTRSLSHTRLGLTCGLGISREILF